MSPTTPQLANWETSSTRDVVLAMHNGQLQPAKQRLQKIISKTPNSVPALSLLVLNNIQQKDLKSAKKVLKQLRKLAKEEPEVQFLKELLERRQAFPEEAWLDSLRKTEPPIPEDKYGFYHFRPKSCPSLPEIISKSTVPAHHKTGAMLLALHSNYRKQAQHLLPKLLSEKPNSLYLHLLAEYVTQAKSRTMDLAMVERLLQLKNKSVELPYREMLHYVREVSELEAAGCYSDLARIHFILEEVVDINPIGKMIDLLNRGGNDAEVEKKRKQALTQLSKLTESATSLDIRLLHQWLASQIGKTSERMRFNRLTESLWLEAWPIYPLHQEAVEALL